MTLVRKNYEDVYGSISVTTYMLYLGFNVVGINPEHPKVVPVVTAVVCMLIKFSYPFV